MILLRLPLLWALTHLSSQSHPSKREFRTMGNPKVTLTVATDRSSKEMLVKLYEEHYDAMVRLASFLLDDVESCEEVVQDAFVKLFTTANPEPGKEVAYLRAVVLNGTRSRMRRRRVRRQFRHEEPKPEASAESVVVLRRDTEQMLGVLRRLPKRQAEVLILRFYQDLSEAEIAETLGISQGSVKTHSSRGLAALRSLLGGSETDAETGA